MICTLNILIAAQCLAQETDSLNELKSKAVKVFIDCNRCDNNFIRSEITFINYVRDRSEAQVHILVTTQETGSGGTEYTITFIGQKDFDGVNDTLKYSTKQSDTDENIRNGIARVMKLGLVRYAIKTPFSDNLSVSFNLPTTQAAVVDKWNYWVFNANMNGYFNGQSSSNSIDIYSSLSANRVTPDIKISLSVNSSYGENNYNINIDSLKYSSISRSQGTWASVVFSLSDHWSAGGSTSANSSTYSNQRLFWYIGPSIEYDIFPYAEATRRQLRISYELEFGYRKYEEETIYFKTSERLVRERIEAAYEVKEPWGTIEVSTSASHYFHDFNIYNLRARGSVSFRVLEGLSIRVSGNVTKVHDQISLPKSGASLNAILTRQVELPTQFYYGCSFGFSYTFGSIYNNVVNPRFGD